MTEVGGSATFEPGGGVVLSAEPPAAKRARFEPTADLAPEPVTEIAVREEMGSGEEEVHHLTVPQTQFEIEINSGPVEDEDDVVRETILPQDLNGPAFSITTAPQVYTGVVAATELRLLAVYSLCKPSQLEFWRFHILIKTLSLQDLPPLSAFSGDESAGETDGRTLNAIGRYNEETRTLCVSIGGQQNEGITCTHLLSVPHQSRCIIISRCPDVVLYFTKC